MSVASIERAREALRLAESDPARSVELASETVRRARSEHDPAAWCVAERALGLAAVHLQDLDTAIRHLRNAIRLGQRARSLTLAGEARMTLAFALIRRGRSSQALREIEAALLDLTGVERARALAQRGTILHQLGRLDDALTAYRSALPVLRRARDLLWTLRVVSNRGILHGARHEFMAAKDDLREAKRLSEELGSDLWVGFSNQNLGWLYALRGDVPVALHHLDLAERRFRALNSHVGSLLEDRGELLLSALLISEAREILAQAVEEFEREGRKVAVPQVRLLLARAAALDGDHESALAHSRQAVREFTQQRRPEWADVARLAVLTAKAAGPQREDIALRRAERTADALAIHRRRTSALEARILAAQLALDRGWIDRARRQLVLASRSRHHGPAVLRARAWYAEAILRHASDNPRGAKIALKAGLRVLDEHRATLGATDLRAHVSGHRTDLAELGIRIALQERDARQAFAWAEQGRASHLMMRPVFPPDDPVLANALAELRGTATDIDQCRRDGRPTTRLVHRMVTLERTIRDYLRQQDHKVQIGPAELVSVSELADALGDAALIEFIVVDQTIHAVTVIDGRVRLQLLGPMAQLRDFVDMTRFALHRLSHRRTSSAGRAAALTLLRRAGSRFDEVLLRPLVNLVADRPLVLIPTGLLQSLPWSILPSCAGRPVTVSPSARLWISASWQRPKRSQIAVAAGPGVPGAHAEAEAVAAIHGTSALVGSSATVDAVMEAIDGASLAHLATHGRTHQHNPLFSSLRLADGPLTAYDLERLKQAPSTAILAACDSGHTAVRAGDELLGLSATFLSQGTQQLVASVVPILDVETKPLMIALHRFLTAGLSVAEALSRAQQQVANEDSSVLATAAGFICIGAGLAPVASSMQS